MAEIRIWNSSAASAVLNQYNTVHLKREKRNNLYQPDQARTQPGPALHCPASPSPAWPGLARHGPAWHALCQCGKTYYKQGNQNNFCAKNQRKFFCSLFHCLWMVFYETQCFGKLCLIAFHRIANCKNPFTNNGTASKNIFCFGSPD